ncbi:MAG TPA: ribbon-helix-helix domain-containing protein [Smithella sp.]|nr:ribbon-helix-helix domain-containing protein [Smithella sp.]
MGKSKSSLLSPKSDWKLFGGRIPPELAKAVRILSIKEDSSIQDLMIEALTDVLMKHGEKPPRK